MKKSMILRFFFLSVTGLFLSFSGMQAQIHVATDGDVGIGSASPQGKLYVSKSTNSAPYTAYFLNSEVGSGTKNGVYSYVTSSGTGPRVGFRNYAYSSSTNTKYAYGSLKYTLTGRGYTVGDYNRTVCKAGNNQSNFGVYNLVETPTSGAGFGIYNFLSTTGTTSGIRYGIFSRVLNNGNGATYALYSSAEGSGSGSRYAGYFNGNVHVVGTLTQTSDARAKENIIAVEGALGLISQLKPKAYTFKADADMSVPEGKQFGFLAQELEEVLPSLVKTVEQPIAANEVDEPLSEEELAKGDVPQETLVTKGSKTLKSVNYIALIPILVQGMQEQQAEIKAQREEIEALRKLLEEK